MKRKPAWGLHNLTCLMLWCLLCLWGFIKGMIWFKISTPPCFVKTKDYDIRDVQLFHMQYIFYLFESFGTFCDRNIREDISPTLNINTFIFSKDVIYLTNKHSMNIKHHVLFYTLHFALKKRFKYLSLVKHLETGYWRFSDIIYMTLSLSLFP